VLAWSQALQHGIRGISRSSLWQSWKEIRTELKQATVRDVIDFLDYDIEPEIWIRRLLRQISLGVYEPHSPTRFFLAKSGGFKRRLSVLAIPDLVLFRTLANFVHRRALKYQQPHVYYRRIDLHRASESAAKAARNDINRVAAVYRFTSARSFRNWLEYEQYRKHLILKRVYRYIVLTDVTNFFDSVLHSQVSNAFRNFPVPSRLIGILFFLLERLAVRADYSDSPGIGLPVDEFECSRTIANLVLFLHDKRMVRLAGKQAYVRWMDDQCVGANSRSEGLRMISEIGESLADLYLTANSKKTKVLSLREARIHYHLDTNAHLDGLEHLIESHKTPLRTLVRKLRKIWRNASKHKNEGEWEKIQKRIYRLGGLTKARFLRTNAVRDILDSPTLTDRIADYMRCSGSTAEYLIFINRVLTNKKQIHKDVELVLVESLLRVEVTGRGSGPILKLAVRLLKEVEGYTRHFAFAAPACLLIVRFGGRRYLADLRHCFQEHTSPKPPLLVRAAAIAYASYGQKQFLEVRKAASMLLSNPLALLVRMVWRLQSLKEIPDRFKARLSIRLDSVRGRHYIDMRTVVAARLLRLNRRKVVRAWLVAWIAHAKSKRVSVFDQNLIAKIAK
jgi:hypothetical protein